MSTMLTIFNNVPTDTGTYGLALKSASKFLSTERVESCRRGMNDIEEKESFRSIEALREAGELSEETKLICLKLDAMCINADMMTPEEADRLHKFATNATDDIVEKKIEEIMNIVTKVIHGRNTKRDYEFDEEKAEAIKRLQEKGVRYEHGEIDLSRGFDYSIYPKDLNSTSEKEFANLLLTLTDEELLEEGIIDEEDFFVYGPYTAADLEYLTGFAQDTWTRVTDGRNTSRLGNFYEGAAKRIGFQIDDDLNKNFISREILPQRRLKAKNMISLIGGFAQECNEVIFSEPKKYSSNGYFQQLLKNLQLFTYYFNFICGHNPEAELKNWNEQTTDSANYAKAVDIAEAWTEDEEKAIESDYGSYLMKLDDHLFEAQAIYLNLVSSIVKPKRKQKKSPQGQLLLQS